MNRLALSATFLLAFGVLADPSHTAQAAESYDNCTGFITSVPTVITTPGTWCLKHDLATTMSSGFAITIGTNNVTIDCNDFKLGGLAAGVATQALGVYADRRLNATIRNCNIRGFHAGVYLSGGGGHLVEDSRFEGNTNFGILVEGDGSTIRRNSVFDTGGSTGYPDAIAIEGIHSCDILDNTVSGVAASEGGTSIGIFAQYSSGGSISGNHIRGVLSSTSSSSQSAYGINSSSGLIGMSTRVSIRNNIVVGDSSAGSIGLGCASATDRAMQNNVLGFATGIQKCSDDGGNVVAP